jgi:hypothetical protein
MMQLGCPLHHSVFVGPLAFSFERDFDNSKNLYFYMWISSRESCIEEGFNILMVLKYTGFCFGTVGSLNIIEGCIWILLTIFFCKCVPLSSDHHLPVWAVIGLIRLDFGMAVTSLFRSSHPFLDSHIASYRSRDSYGLDAPGSIPSSARFFFSP